MGKKQREKSADDSEKVNPLDPLGVGAATLDVWKSLVTHPEGLLAAQAQFAGAWMQIAAGAAVPPSAEHHDVVQPAPSDGRWKHPAWHENPVFSAIKQAYLLSSKAVLDSVDAAEGVDENTKTLVRFFARQFCDAMSPTNVAMFNPAVIEETLRTGGANLEAGLRNVVDDIEHNAGRPALVDRDAFTVGENLATTRGSVVFRNDLMELIQYDATTAEVYERPLVIVPPWINKFYILDLQPENSFVKYATEQGFTTFVVSWRNPDASFADVTMDDYLERGALAAVNVAREICDAKKANVIGYCIGGTLVAMLLAYLARIGERPIRSATFFAALVDFADAGDLRAFTTPQGVAYVENIMKERGVLDGSEMGLTFNLLRANDLIWNVAVNRYLLGKDAPAFDLLYWNDDATRMPRAMHGYYLRNMYVENNLAKPDALRVRDVPIDLGRIANDAYCVATAEDHIAPWRSVYRMTQLFGGEVLFRLGHSGHIAGIISPPGGKKKSRWWSASSHPKRPEAWRAIAKEHEGSWWPDWSAWLAERSGGRRPAPAACGSEAYPPIAAAPGTYVLER